MTPNDPFISDLEAYLENHVGTTPLPEDVRDAVRASLPTIHQRPAWWPAQRFTPMSTMVRYGVLAAAAVAIAVIGFNVVSNQVGPAPSPSPTPDTEAAVPPELQHFYLGEIREATRAADGTLSHLYFTANEFQFAVDFGADAGVFRSEASFLGPDTIILRSIDQSGGCTTGDEGRYPFSTSPGGSFLTVGTGTDACAARAASLPGEWLRSDCWNSDNSCLGMLEAGSYSSQFIEPRPAGEWQPRFGALTFTVPDGWAASADWPTDYAIVTAEAYAAIELTGNIMSCIECSDGIYVGAAPRAASESCGELAEAGVGTSVDELVTWILERPGLVTSDPESISLNGLPAVVIDIEAATNTDGMCSFGVPLFYNEYHWVAPPGGRQQIILVDLDEDLAVLIIIEAGDPADLDGLVERAMPIIETFEFPFR